MPKVPKITPPRPSPTMASQASFMSSGGSSRQSGPSAGRLFNPIIGQGRSLAGRPSLLGGM